MSINIDPIKAMAYLFDECGQIVGAVYFKENLHFWQTEISIDIWNVKKPGEHGIHIHDLGAVDQTLLYSCKNPCSIPCGSLGGHYDPYKTNRHGTFTDNIDQRHVGDMGNVFINSSGWGSKTIWDRLIQLRGTYSVIGKAVVLHEDRDDLGRSRDRESRTTGHSGKRLACGLIFRKK